MIAEIAALIDHNRRTLAEDLAGALSLVFMLIGGLHLPLLF